jgi:hypothetical protein
MTVAEEHIPSPADAPQHTAEELLQEIVDRGGRVFRMPEVAVFCLTTDEELARWLQRLGGKQFLPSHLRPEDLGPRRAYRRAPGGTWEWDIYIHAIPVNGETTIHEAAKNFQVGS